MGKLFLYIGLGKPAMRKSFLTGSSAGEEKRE
jgi:hypothetical protein